MDGFHHDLKNNFEKTGPLKFANKIIDEHGCYKADLMIDGHLLKQKSFFPAHWSREEVICKIKEAYENFKKTGIDPEKNKEKFIIQGFTNEGIKIEVWFNISGEMRTAYPIVNKELL